MFTGGKLKDTDSYLDGVANNRGIKSRAAFATAGAYLEAELHATEITWV